MRSVASRVERLERERRLYDVIIARVLSLLTESELSQLAGDTMARLSIDELEAIAAGGDPPEGCTEEPLPVWWWRRVKEIVTAREHGILERNAR